MADFKKNYPSIPEPTIDPASMLRTLKAIKEAVEILTGQRAKGASGIEDLLTDLRSQAEGRQARFTEYVEVSTANDIALAQRTTTLEVENDAQEARITQVDTARATGDDALAQRATTIEASVTTLTGSVNARFTDVITAYVNADSALATRDTQLQANIDTTYGYTDAVNARVGSVESASVTRDGFLAQRIDTVEGSSGAGTANGRIRFQAGNVTGGAGGVYASYDLFLTAANGYGDTYAGFSVLAKTDGTSSITFYASTFTLFDPALGPLPVFNYQNGKFRFNVPVEVLGTQLAPNAASNSWFGYEGGGLGVNPLDVQCTTREGSTIELFAEFGGQNFVAFNLADQFIMRLQRIHNGDVAGRITLSDRQLSIYVVNGQKFPTYTGLSYQDNPPAGVNTYRVFLPFQNMGPLSLRVTERFR